MLTNHTSFVEAEIAYRRERITARLPHESRRQAGRISEQLPLGRRRHDGE
jgi:hypothetical protein